MKFCVHVIIDFFFIFLMSIFLLNLTQEKEAKLVVFTLEKQKKSENFSISLSKNSEVSP